jgi:hypothetical protein
VDDDAEAPVALLLDDEDVAALGVGLEVERVALAARRDDPEHRGGAGSARLDGGVGAVAVVAADGVAGCH